VSDVITPKTLSVEHPSEQSAHPLFLSDESDDASEPSEHSTVEGHPGERTRTVEGHPGERTWHVHLRSFDKGQEQAVDDVRNCNETSIKPASQAHTRSWVRERKMNSAHKHKHILQP
jgi:hypothetical protein